MIRPSPVSRIPGSFLHPLSTPAKAAGIRAAGRPPSGRANGLRPFRRLRRRACGPPPHPAPPHHPGPPHRPGPAPALPSIRPASAALPRPFPPPRRPAPPLHRPSRKSAPSQMLPNYPGNKSPVPPISYANQTPVCKTSVNKCCFLTLPMQKPPVFTVLVEGLFPSRPKNLPLPLSSPRRLWYNIAWTFANISKR